MVDTPTTRASIQAQLADNTSGLDTPQNARNFVVTVLGPSVALTPSGGAVTWPLATAPIATVTITQNTVITVTGGEDGFGGYRLAIIQGGAGGFTATFSGVTLSSPVGWNSAPGSNNRIYIDCVGTTLMADPI